ncbi:MAG: PIG-L family deacetylase [Chlorobiaceae bacterium]|jgi:LmbE family N-acetylglucosaminyl deacetylase|nr:PIG-L family deacetylase [Chlorobiaceae bacterium]
MMLSLKKKIKPLYLLIKRNLLRIFLIRAKGMILPRYRNIIVVAPHPDDEVLGLGGFITQCLREEVKVYIIYLTDGEASLPDIDPEVVASKRIGLSNAVLVRLGISGERIFRMHLPDGGIPRKNTRGFDEAAERMRQIFSSLMPDAVFVTHPLDTWPYDHVAAFELAEKAIGNIVPACEFYGYWVWLWYSMPLKLMGRIDRIHTSCIPVHNVMDEKKFLMDLYLKSLASNGKPWSGVLPKEMIAAFHYPYEFVTRLR